MIYYALFLKFKCVSFLSLPKLRYDDVTLFQHQVNREAIRGAKLLANPGCYPTAAQIPLIPLLRSGLISAEDIIIDAKSGIYILLRFEPLPPSVL